MKVCSQCNSENNDIAKFCKNCGNNIEAVQPMYAQPQPVQPQPVYTQPAQPMHTQPVQPQPMYVQPQPVQPQPGIHPAYSADAAAASSRCSSLYASSKSNKH